MDPRQEQLRRQLANDEPKCGNCAHWRAHSPGAGVGDCFLLGVAQAGTATIWQTTDLAVCSQWEPK
jgi:hypothetical protein